MLESALEIGAGAGDLAPHERMFAWMVCAQISFSFVGGWVTAVVNPPAVESRGPLGGVANG
jgi:hypothetical protein